MGARSDPARPEKIEISIDVDADGVHPQRRIAVLAPPVFARLHVNPPIRIHAGNNKQVQVRHEILHMVLVESRLAQHNGGPGQITVNEPIQKIDAGIRAAQLAGVHAAGEQDRESMIGIARPQAHRGSRAPFPGVVRKRDDRAEVGKQISQIRNPLIEVRRVPLQSLCLRARWRS